MANNALSKETSDISEAFDAIAVYLIPGMKRGPAIPEWREAAAKALPHLVDEDLRDDLKSLLEVQS